MDKLLEALGNILPKDQVEPTASAISEILEEEVKRLEEEKEKKLEEAYAQLSAELAEAEQVGEEGYKQALAVIEDLENRNKAQKKEFELFMKEQYAVAMKKIEEAEAKNEKLESAMYEEYDAKLDQMKTYIVDKVDQFLHNKGRQIYEQARRDVLNDPRMAEHKVVLDKVAGIMSDYLSEEDVTLATSSKLESLYRENEKLRSEIKRHEGRNIRLSTEKTKMANQLSEAVQLLREHDDDAVLNEQKERVRKAANVQGRGKAVLNEGEEIIKEHNANVKAGNNDDSQQSLMESLGISDFEEARKLAGLD